VEHLDSCHSLLFSITSQHALSSTLSPTKVTFAVLELHHPYMLFILTSFYHLSLWLFHYSYDSMGAKIWFSC